MPFVQLTTVGGRTSEEKRALIKAVSAATADTLGIPIDRVRMAIYELAPDQGGVGGQTVAEFQAARAAAEQAAQGAQAANT